MNKNTITEMITKNAKENNLAGYHITTIYTEAETAIAATKHLNRCLPCLFDLLIGSNWRRKNTFDAFALFALLTEPGSRLRPQPGSVPIGSVQDSFHHHSILLVEPWIADRINVKFPWIVTSDLPIIAPDAFAEHSSRRDTSALMRDPTSLDG